MCLPLLYIRYIVALPITCLYKSTTMGGGGGGGGGGKGNAEDAIQTFRKFGTVIYDGLFLLSVATRILCSVAGPYSCADRFNYCDQIVYNKLFRLFIKKHIRNLCVKIKNVTRPKPCVCLFDASSR